jgi:hypothetical protein
MRAFGMSVIAATLGVTIAILNGVSAPGETREMNLATTCAHMDWPAIPASCLIGATARPVRVISDAPRQADDMAMRFATAFE